MLDFEAITGAVTSEDPSGPDLDSDGDAQYLNFFAGTEPLLPMSYFEVVGSSGQRGRFDPKSVDFEAQFSAAKPLLARTRDLRLIVLLAKLSILNRDLSGFAGCLAAIPSLLETQWNTVHPRDDDGDFTYRAVTIESLDALPTVVNPIQFQPLIENRRFGTVTYRAYQTATGEIASNGDTDLDLATIERIVAETDLDALKAISVRFAELSGTIARTKAIWLDKAGKPLSLGQFASVVDNISGWLQKFVRERDPASVEVLPTSVTNVHCIFGITPDANSDGHAEMYTINWTPTSPPPDMAAPPSTDMAIPPVRDMAMPPSADMATPATTRGSVASPTCPASV